MVLIINTCNLKNFVAIAKDSEAVDVLEWESNNNQSELLLSRIDDLLKKNESNKQEISEIIVINGPGSYTGIRVSISVANSLAYALKVSIKEINWLDILKSSVGEKCVNSTVLSLIHAIEDKYYYGLYTDGILEKYGNEKISDLNLNDQYYVIGDIKREDKKILKNIHCHYKNTKKISSKEYVHILLSANMFTKKVKISKPFYINKPNITPSKKQNKSL